LNFSGEAAASAGADRDAERQSASRGVFNSGCLRHHAPNLLAIDYSYSLMSLDEWFKLICVILAYPFFDVRATIFIETDITLNDLGAIQQRAVEWPPIEGADDPTLTGHFQ